MSVFVVVVRVKFALQFPLLPQKQQLLSYIYNFNIDGQVRIKHYIYTVPSA